VILGIHLPPVEVEDVGLNVGLSDRLPFSKTSSWSWATTANGATREMATT
jgi:hypothetical protein